MESILNTIKKLLGVDPSYFQFDVDIIIAINTALNALTQMGVGPKSGFQITGDQEKWKDFIGNDILLNDVKSYIWIKTKNMFDPDLTSSVTEARNNLLKEIEYRILIHAEKGDASQ